MPLAFVLYKLLFHKTIALLTIKCVTQTKFIAAEVYKMVCNIFSYPLILQ